MGREKTKAGLHKHARKRCIERYGVEFNKTLKNFLLRAIQSGDCKRARPVVKQSLNRKVFDVPFEDEIFRVVYDRKRHAIVTMLTMDMGVK